MVPLLPLRFAFIAMRERLSCFNSSKVISFFILVSYKWFKKYSYYSLSDFYILFFSGQFGFIFLISGAKVQQISHITKFCPAELCEIPLTLHFTTSVRLKSGAKVWQKFHNAKFQH